MKIADLKLDPKNANRGTRRGQKAVQDSLARYGAGRSILIDRNGVIIAGNQTVKNANALGNTDVLVVQTTGDQLVAVQRTDLDANDPKARELAIADNRASELGLEWNPEMLADAELDLKPFFTDAELKELLPDTAVELIGDEDDAPEAPADPVTKLGDLYILGDHRLLCGDSTSPADIDLLLNGEKVEMVFTDPPYGIKVKMNNPGTVCNETILGDQNTDVAVATFNYCSSLDIPMVFWGANHYGADAHLPNSSSWLCWNKQEANNHIDQSDGEFAWTNLGGPARVFNHLWSGFRRASEKGEKRVHPTQKPVALIVEILNFFGAGTVILDLFGSSGSTLIACEKTGRKARLMELDPKYCDVIVARWEKATGKKAILDGQPT